MLSLPHGGDKNEWILPKVPNVFRAPGGIRTRRERARRAVSRGVLVISGGSELPSSLGKLVPRVVEVVHELEGDVAEEIAKHDGPELQVHGSQNLIQTLLQHNLIDQLGLWIFPVVVRPV